MREGVRVPLLMADSGVWDTGKACPSCGSVRVSYLALRVSCERAVPKHATDGPNPKGIAGIAHGKESPPLWNPAWDPGGQRACMWPMDMALRDIEYHIRKMVLFVTVFSFSD